MTEKRNNIYAPPKAKLDIEQRNAIFADKRNIVIDDTPIFPERCHQCNMPSENTIKTKLRHYPPYTFLPLLWYFFGRLIVDILDMPIRIFTILCIAVPFIVIILMVTKGKTIRFELPVCGHHARLRKIALVGTLFCSLAVVVSFFNIFSLRSSKSVGITLIVLLVCCIALILLNMMRPYIRIIRATEKRYWLRGTGKAFRDSLPDW